MRELPIPMNGPMVRGTLADIKTVTRRLVRPQPKVYRDFLSDGYVFGIEDKERPWVVRCLGSINFTELYSPYKVGDRLWVRESCRVVEHEPYGRVRVRYEADGSYGVAEFPSRLKPVAVGKCIANGCHREAARITLEVTSVRVERLQDITTEQALAEGALSWAQEQDSPIRDLPAEDARVAFAGLWKSTGGDWDANPFVWVVEFQQLRRNIA